MSSLSSEIVVGIDFGTTHSGVSWAVNGGAKKIRLITDWPNPESANPTSEKVPSCISYVDGKPTNWGFQVGFAEDSFKWIKILLEPNHKYRKAIEPVKISNRLLGTLKKTAVEVVADYLRFLWTYTTDDIRRRQGDDYLSIYSLRIILTVPAIWSDAAKDKTLQAARLAGLPSDITLVTEPEAAALATLRDKAETSNLKVGDAFVVCDAGGGTVDLISYRIDSLDPMKISECAIGDGGLCGSVFLDTAFQKNISILVGEQQYAGLKERSKKKMLRDFEYGIKRCFRATDSRAYSVDLKGVLDDLARGIDDETITVSVSALKTIFDFVCLQIEVLVQQQISQVRDKGMNVKSILLVGGFGESVYLYDLLSNCHKSEGIPVLQVVGAWSSICRGATMWGLERPGTQNSHVLPTTTVTSRLSRYSYGVSASHLFDPSRHLPHERFECLATGEARAKDQMEWFLKRGDTIKEGTKIARLYHYQRQAKLWSKTMLPFSKTLDYCADEYPPSRKTNSVKKLCQISWQISSSTINIKEKSFKNPRTGEKWRDIPITLSVGLGNASLDFSFEYRDKLSQTVQARYVDDMDSLSDSVDGLSIEKV